MRCKSGYLGANRSKGWNAATLADTGRYFSPYSIDDRGTVTAPLDVFVTPDGASVFVASSDNYIDKFTASAPWRIAGPDITHAQSFSVASQETSLRSVFFKTDGLKMYIAGLSGNDITEYSLASPWDISTSVHVTQKSLATSAPLVVRISPDGLHMHILHRLAGSGAGYERARTSQYAITTAWDVSTASHVRDFDFPTDTGYLQPAGFTMKHDGRAMFYGANFSGYLIEYELSDPWNVSTAVLRRTSGYIDEFGGVFFSDDGTSCYLGNTIGLIVSEFSSI